MLSHRLLQRFATWDEKGKAAPHCMTGCLAEQLPWEGCGIYHEQTAQHTFIVGLSSKQKGKWDILGGNHVVFPLLYFSASKITGGKSYICPSANITEGWREGKRMRCCHLRSHVLVLFSLCHICFISLYTGEEVNFTEYTCWVCFTARRSLDLVVIHLSV